MMSLLVLFRLLATSTLLATALAPAVAVASAVAPSVQEQGSADGSMDMDFGGGLRSLMGADLDMADDLDALVEDSGDIDEDDDLDMYRLGDLGSFSLSEAEYDPLEEDDELVDTEQDDLPLLEEEDDDELEELPLLDEEMSDVDDEIIDSGVLDEDDDYLRRPESRMMGTGAAHGLEEVYDEDRFPVESAADDRMDVNAAQAEVKKQLGFLSSIFRPDQLLAMFEK